MAQGSSPKGGNCWLKDHVDILFVPCGAVTLPRPAAGMMFFRRGAYTDMFNLRYKELSDGKIYVCISLARTLVGELDVEG